MKKKLLLSVVLLFSLAISPVLANEKPLDKTVTHFIIGDPKWEMY